MDINMKKEEFIIIITDLQSRLGKWQLEVEEEIFVDFSMGCFYEEMLIGRKFVVYKDTMKFWEAPHEKEEITSKQIVEIMNEVQKNTNENTVQLIFE